MLAPTPYFADRGCHVRIYEEAVALIRQGCDVRIVTYHIGRDMPEVPTYRIPNIPWYRRLTAGPSWQKPFLDTLLLFKALSVFRQFRPHILHAHLHEGAFIGMLLKPYARIPLIMDFQGSMTGECLDHGFFKSGSLTARAFSIVERTINNAADAIITSSTSGAEALSRDWDVLVSKVYPVIDGVDTERFRPLSRKDARSSLGIPDTARLAVFLGALNKYQGVDIILEAAAILRTSGIRFLVMGFPEEEYLRKAKAMGLETTVTFTGRINYDRAALYLCAGDLAISPKLSLNEANGKLFNYMACGLPTVAFDTLVSREILGNTGVYAKYGDAADFAKKIAELFADRQRLIHLGLITRRRAEQEHSWDSRAIRVLELYKSLIKN